MEFRFAVPSSVRFGRGTVKEIGVLLKELKVEKIMLVYDKGVYHAGLTKPVETSVKREDIEIVPFDKVQPNPEDKTICEGAALAREKKVQAVVAVGGGSAMDCAKGINVLFANPEPIVQYEGGDKVPKKGLPLICIPTTSGTSSEITSVCIITDTTDERKYIMAGRNVGADYSLVDPDMMDGLPAGVTAATGMDALTHAIESYVSLGANPLTKPLSLQAAKLIYQNLAKAVEGKDAKDARNNMALACVIVGCAFSNAGLGLVHAIAHTLGAHFHLAHGTACAVTLPYVIDYNYTSAKEAYEELTEALRPDGKASLSEMVRELELQIGIPRLRDCGVPEDQLAFLAKETMREDYMTNPNQIINEEIVLDILKKAY